MNTAEIRDMSDEEILDRIDQMKEEMFRLRFRAATTELENPMLLRTLRRDVARLKTVLHQRELTAGAEQA